MGVEIDDRQQRLTIAQAQYAASSTIYGSNDPVEILDAMVNFGGRPFAEAHMGLLDTETGALSVIVVRDQNGIAPTNFQRALETYPAFETLSAVEVLYIADVTADPFLTDEERALVESHGISSMLVIPLMVGQRFSGLIEFSNPTPVTVSQDALRAMRNLGDQIAVVFENQSLLRSTASTLQEVQGLYDINRAMLSAVDPLDVLRVLRDYLAQLSASITHAVVERRPDSSAESITIRHIVTSAMEQAVNVPVMGLRKAVDAFGEAEGTDVVFIEDMESPAEKTLLHETLKAENTRSYIAIVVRERGLIEDFIAIAFDQPQRFDARIRRLYGAVADQIGIVLQNQRLLRDAQSSAIQLTRQVRVLQALNRLSAGITSFQNEKELLDYTVQNLVTTLNVDHVGVATLDSRQERSIVVSEYPLHGAVGTEIDVRRSAIFAALHETPDRPVIIQNVETDSMVEPEVRDVFKKMGTIGLMVMPLQAAGTIIGTVNFDLYERGRQFTPEMIETSQTMLSQVAVGLQNIRLLIDAQRRADQLQRIALFSQSVQATLNLETILNIMVSESTQMIPMDRMSISLYDTRQGQLRIVAQYEDEKTSIDLVNGPLVSMSGTFVGQVWETQEMLTIGDTMTTSNARRMQEVSVRSLMIVPIRSRGRLLGTVNVGCFRPYAYIETDQAIFQQMINQLAVAMENAEAYRQSQRVAKNEALINEIATHLQQHTDVEDMLQIAINELGQALGARRGRIRLALQETDGDGGES